MTYRYGWPEGKQGHSAWLQACAEHGLPGGLLLIGFFATALWIGWRIARDPEAEPWRRDVACMLSVGLAGFATAVAFVSIDLLEVPYFLALFAVYLRRPALEEDLADDELPRGDGHGDPIARDPGPVPLPVHPGDRDRIPVSPDPDPDGERVVPSGEGEPDPRSPA